MTQPAEALPPDVAADQPTAADNQDLARRRARYETWVRRHHAEIYRLLARLCQNDALAEDLCQDAFVKAWRSMDQFRGRGAWTWLARIAVNEWRGHHRRRAEATSELDDHHPDPRPTPDEAAQAGDVESRVMAALARLPEAYREALTLTKLQGLSTRQAGAVLEIPTGTVKWRVSEGLKMLRERLDEEDAR